MNAPPPDASRRLPAGTGVSAPALAGRRGDAPRPGRARSPRRCAAALVRGLVLVLLLCGQGRPDHAVYHYQEQTGAEAATFSWQARPADGGYLVVQQEDDKVITTRCTPDGATLGWRFSDPPDWDLSAERLGNSIRLTGVVRDEAVDMTLRIDDRPWFQSPSFSLQRMLVNGVGKTAFWMIRRDTLEIKALTARKEEVETVGQGGGAGTSAQRVRIRLDGMLAGLWHVDYWFREQDHVFLAYRGVHGPPGTPETVVRLLPP